LFIIKVTLMVIRQRFEMMALLDLLILI